MPDGFKSLADIFKNDPGFAGLRRIIGESDVVAEFYKVFPDLDKIAKAVKIDKRTLYLRVENAAWRNELKFKEETIVNAINKYFNENRISRIKFIQ